MQFNTQVQKRFMEAGWKPGRNVTPKYNQKLIGDYPVFVRAFLNEYGDLIVLDTKKNASNVTNKLRLDPNYSFFEEADDFVEIETLIKEKFFPIGIIEPDGYRIASDAHGKVYMLGDYVFRISDSFKEGIEKLIEYDWTTGFFQLDEVTGKWIKNKSWED